MIKLHVYTYPRYAEIQPHFIDTLKSSHVSKPMKTCSGDAKIAICHTHQNGLHLII